MRHKKIKPLAVIMTLLFLGALVVSAGDAWARAGGGSSSGSRGSRSFSSPSAPSSPSSPYSSSPGFSSSSPGRGPVGSSSPTSSFGRSPFLQGLAGGLAGGLLGNMLFGGSTQAAPGAAPSGGGIGLMDIILLGGVLYLLYRFMKKRKAQSATAPYYEDRIGDFRQDQDSAYQPNQYYDNAQPASQTQGNDLYRGLQDIRQYDATFSEEEFKEIVQDMFFRIQAGWMNRSLSGIDGLLTSEMSKYFEQEFQSMRVRGVNNRLENIAVRKVEPSEAWQEAGKDYITVLFTANLLDYTVDDKTGQVVEGDKLNPVKFQEFWTFCRDLGSRQWKLSAINQMRS